MDMTGIARLTDHFLHWQGLRWLPRGIGAALAASALTGGDGSGVNTGVLVVAAVVIAIGDPLVENYYRRTYGEVRELPSQRLVNAVGRYGAFVPLVLAGLADLTYRLPVLLTGLAAALALLAFWWVSGRGRWHWPVLAALPFAAALAPAAGLVEPGRPGLAALLVVVGFVEVVGGLLDHRTLVTRIREVRLGLQG